MPADTLAPKPGSKAALEQQIDELRAQLARAEADNARLLAAAPTPSLVAPALLVAEVPILVVSEANQRGMGWQKKASRTARHRETVTTVLWATKFALAGQTTWGPNAGRALLATHPRLSVHLERRAGGQLDDDNMIGGCKASRDAIAAWLGCDDGARGPVRWSYSQQAHRRWSKQPCLVVEIRGLP